MRIERKRKRMREREREKEDFISCIQSKLLQFDIWNKIMNVNNIMQNFYFYMYILLSLYRIDIIESKSFVNEKREFKI